MLTTIAALPHTTTGKGPAVVLVHGLSGDRHAWDDVTRELAKTHRVIAVDLPGHGEAAAPARYDVDAIARQIAATVRAEKAAPAVIVGHSLGGFIAAHVPLVDPTVARGLVVVDIGIGELWTPQELDEIRRGLASDRDAMLRGWFGRISQPGAQRERVVASVLKLSNGVLLGYPTATAAAPIADGGRALTLPTLLMASKLLLPGKKPRAEELAAMGFAHVPKLEVVFFDQSMHWLFWDEPQKFMTTLVRYLSTVER